MDQYERYIVSDANTKPNRQLSERLRGLGCSEQFSVLFSKTENLSNHAHVFDRDFVLAALAFLCSRLLGPSKISRAAVTVQRAWRQHWGRVVVARKAHLRVMAESCAGAVHAKKTRNLENEDSQEKSCKEDKEDKAELFKCDETGKSHQDQNADDEDIWLNL